MPEIFTSLNTESAAILGGDPNSVHYRENSFGTQIVGGLHQLAYALTRTGWKPGHQLEASFHLPIKLPSAAAFYPTKDGFVFRDEAGHVLTSGALTPTEKAFALSNPGCAYSCSYEITDDEIPVDAVRDWKNLDRLPRLTARETLQAGSITDLCLAVVLQANTLARFLHGQKTIFPELYFPGVREGGNTGILESRLVLQMHDAPSRLDSVTISASLPFESAESKRSVVMRTGAGGVYSAEMYLTKIPLQVLQRMLRPTRHELFK